MIPREPIDSADVPGGGQLRLVRRGSEYSIMLGTNELMNSRLSGSEEALATMACERIAGTKAPRVLIGGLGMGFTLRAALGCLGRDARLVVAELVPAVVRWAREPMAELFAGSLDDPRVEVVEEDVGALISRGAGWDAVLLDVDNGPDGLSRPENDRLYDEAGLARAFAALRPGGVLAVWSSGPDERFTRRLRRTGFAVEEASVRANKARSGSRHMLWFARKPARGA
jgi:spermidine synthase